jgi:hypothetical protein
MKHAHRVEVRRLVIRMPIGLVGQIALFIVTGTRTTNPVSIQFVQTE